MSVVDHAAAARILPPPSPPVPVRLGFAGKSGDYRRLMIRGAVLQAITLGLYRFWLFTDMRRFLWAATRIADETLEYTGTAAELLIGFLIAIGILIPVYAFLFAVSLEYGIPSGLSGVVAFMVLAGFGQYAAYRARSYRLTRTVFRGLRFHQAGSAAGYAFRAMLWWVSIVLTLGLAWPWAAASLERYKMRNTFYGTLGGGFAGSGTRLFRSGFPIWLSTIGPLAAGLAAGAMVMNWTAVAEALDSAGLKNMNSFLALLILKAADDGRVAWGLALLLGAPLAATLLAAVLYPAFQAVVMRWWIGGLRLGRAAAASDLRIGRYYGASWRYVLSVVLFLIALSIFVGVAAGVGSMILGRPIHWADEMSPATDVLAWAGLIVAYVVFALGVSTIYQVVVKLRLWQAAVESTVVSDYAAFDHVGASEALADAVGEGLTDALGGGGI